MKLAIACGLLLAAADASAQEGDARLRIDSGCLPGEVFVDNKKVGADHAELVTTKGLHRVRIDYGDDYEETRLVYANRAVTTDVLVAPTDYHCKAVHRRGVRFGASLGFVAGSLLPSNTAPFAFGPKAAFALNIGVRRFLDLRTGLAFTFLRPVFGSPDSSSSSSLSSRASRVTPQAPDAIALDVPAHLRFNLGSVYVMGFGANFTFITDTVDKTLAAGPWLNFAGFRLGPRREWELDVGEVGATVVPAPKDPQVVLRWGLTLTYLVLPPPPARRGAPLIHEEELR